MTTEITFFEEDPATGALSLFPLVLDAAPRVEHRANAQATEHEVERGAAVSDHVRPERRVLQLQAIISDTPIRATAALGGEVRPLSLPDGITAMVFQPDAAPTRVADAWRLLERARDRSLLALVETPLRTYENMALLECQTSQTAEDGSWLRVDLTFAEVRQVSTELVAARPRRPARDRDHDVVDHGAQQTRPASERQKASLLRQGLDRLRGR